MGKRESSLGREAGFTLIELLAVLAILAFAATLSLPSIHRLQGGTTRSQLTELQTTFRKFQGEALASKELLRLRYLPETGVLAAEIYEGEEFKAHPEDDLGHTFGEGRLTLVEARRDGRLLDAEWTLLQYPNGSRERTILLVEDSRERRYRLEVPTLLAPVTVERVLEE